MYLAASHTASSKTVSRSVPEPADGMKIARNVDETENEGEGSEGAAFEEGIQDPKQSSDDSPSSSSSSDAEETQAHIQNEVSQ